MIQITIITLICCLLFGVPIAFAIGIAGTAGLYFGSTAPMFMVVKQFLEGINSFSYMAMPLFILAGAIMGLGHSVMAARRYRNNHSRCEYDLRCRLRLRRRDHKRHRRHHRSRNAQKGLQPRLHRSNERRSRLARPDRPAERRYDRFRLHNGLFDFASVRRRHYPRLYHRPEPDDLLLHLRKKAQHRLRRKIPRQGRLGCV